VPVSGLSQALVQGHAATGLVPFVLYGRDRVLAHPLIAGARGAPNEDSTALPRLDELGDAVLARIWSPDYAELELLQGVVNMETSLVRHGGGEYVFLYKSIDRYGPRPWVLGAYVDTRQHGNPEVRRVILAGAGGIGIMICAVAIAMFVGLRVSRHLAALSAAAKEIQGGRLEAGDALGRSGIREIDDAMRSFGQMVAGLRERHLMRSTLGRFVPEPVARSLLDAGGRLAPSETVATILFCDLEGFTALTESRGAQGIVALLNTFFSEMVRILERYGGVVTQFQGDAILATFNVPVTDADHAGNAVRAALAMQRRVETGDFAGERLRIRIGVNTGTVVAGAVGADERLSYTVHGDAVNLAARLESMNKQFGTRILASERTIERVAGFETRRIGETTVRGQTQPIAVYEVVGEPSDGS
jgi:class 3 adenylate cyclase